MADFLTVAQRSQLMSAIRGQRNKTTELVLAAVLRHHRIKGWRRKSPIFGRPDFVFPSQRVAIFVDGCFWHGCPLHFRAPSTREEFWQQKLNANRQRDKLVNRVLRARGWHVLRVWEHELAIKNRARLLRRLQRAIIDHT